jgi:hypothetical protein
MKLDRLPYEPAALIEFYQESLEHLGAVCERTWHDRLQLVAEGAAAKLWNDDGALHEAELHFPPAGDTAPRNAATEAFPGSPLTFRLAETLRPTPLPIDRAILAGGPTRPPAVEVAEKLWHAQFPHGTRWRMAMPFRAAHTFSLLALVRCEIQAIDQHWSLRRVALSLPDGERDAHLAGAFTFAEVEANTPADLVWPSVPPDIFHRFISDAVELEMTDELAGIRARQENYLRRELDRIDDYFQSYEAELSSRASRAGANTKVKTADRLAAAQAEHARRREDQVKRHEIRIIPHLDAVLLLAENAWQTQVNFHEHNQPRTMQALFNPRSRRWRLA